MADLISMLDRLGQVVKNSPYDCYKFEEQTTTYSWMVMEKVLKLLLQQEFDYVGSDP